MIRIMKLRGMRWEGHVERKGRITQYVIGEKARRKETTRKIKM
jgi:hypothetical protein